LSILVVDVRRVARALEQYCVEGCSLTYNGVERDGKTPTQGGYSNKIVVDENYVLRIPDKPLLIALLLSCVQASHFIRL
jgi:alcohol dehydrogenase (NADP+)